MNETCFLTQIKRHIDGTYEKGVVVKDNINAARQSFHAYLGAYGYDHDPDVDYVACYITDINGARVDWKVDDRRPKPEPAPEVEG